MSYLSNANQIASELRSFNGGRTENCVSAIMWNDRVGTRLKNSVIEIVKSELNDAMKKASSAIQIDTSQIERTILTAKSHLSNY